MYFLKKYIYF